MCAFMCVIMPLPSSLFDPQVCFVDDSAGVALVTVYSLVPEFMCMKLVTGLNHITHYTTSPTILSLHHFTYYYHSITSPITISPSLHLSINSPTYYFIYLLLIDVLLRSSNVYDLLSSDRDIVLVSKPSIWLDRNVRGYV